MTKHANHQPGKPLRVVKSYRKKPDPPVACHACYTPTTNPNNYCDKHQDRAPA